MYTSLAKLISRPKKNYKDNFNIFRPLETALKELTPQLPARRASLVIPETQKLEFYEKGIQHLMNQKAVYLSA
jgi:hypothetical protein